MSAVRRLRVVVNEGIPHLCSDDPATHATVYLTFGLN